MKKLLLLVCSCWIICLAQAQDLRAMSPAELKSFVADCDRPLVVCFWATWCASCLEEIPWFIEAVNTKYAGKAELLLVSLDPRSLYPARLRSFVGAKKITAPVAWLSEPNADVFCTVIDPKWTGAIPAALMVNNATGYRKFYPNGLSPLQVERELGILLNEKQR
jgi:hypothetical protein